MPYVIGIVLSAGVAVFASRGFDRDRAFYPTVMIVIAAYYVLFAVMSGSVQTVVIESVVMTLFAAAAVAGFKWSAWIVVAGLAGHGVFDAVHGYVIENAGVPDWWRPGVACDVGAAAGFGSCDAGLSRLMSGGDHVESAASTVWAPAPTLLSVRPDSIPLAGSPLIGSGSRQGTAR